MDLQVKAFWMIICGITMTILLPDQSQAQQDFRTPFNQNDSSYRQSRTFNPQFRPSGQSLFSPQSEESSSDGLIIPEPPKEGEDDTIPPNPQQAQKNLSLAETEARLREFLEQNPGHEEAIIRLTTFLYQQNRKSEAIQFLHYQIVTNSPTLKMQLLLGQLYLDMGWTVTAQAYLEDVYNCNGCGPDVTFWLGSAYLQNEYPLAAYRMLNCGPTSSADIEQARQLGRAAALASLGLYGESITLLQSVQANAGNQETRNQAYELQQQIDDIVCNTDRFYGSLKFTGRYDTNPGIVPTSNVVGLPAIPVNTGGNLYLGQFNYDFYRDYNNTVTGGYTFLHTSNYEAHGADLLDNAFYLAGSHRGIMGDTPYVAGLRADYDYLEVGSEEFLQRFGVAPTFSVIHNDLETTTFSFRYTILDFVRQGALEGTVLDVDSNNYLFGITRSREFPCQGLTVFGSYLYDFNVSNGGNFDYDGHQAVLGLVWLIPGCDRWQLNMTGTYYNRGYDDLGAISGIRRVDQEYITNVSLLYEVSEDWFISLGWLRDRNDSNVALSDYERDVLELGIQYNFPSGHPNNQTFNRRRTGAY